jgi:hypothetical protein
MSRANFIVRSIVIGIALCVSLSGVAVAQDKDAKDLRAYLCKDIMRMSGEDRSIAIAFLHGYMLGKKRTTTFDTQLMAEATDEFIEYCLEHPGAKALDAMNKFLK